MNILPCYRITKLKASVIALAIGVVSLASSSFARENALRWWQAYTGPDANGPTVLGYWNFDKEDELGDRSSHKNEGKLRGATWNTDGRFPGGGCIDSSVGYPVIDESHSYYVKRAPSLSPASAFTLEMWLRPRGGAEYPDQAAPALLDSKYVPTNHTGFSLGLSNTKNAGARTVVLELGLGVRTERWYSQPIKLKDDVWQHLAVTYDGKGTTNFFLDGDSIGTSRQDNAGGMAAATRDLAIGDRIGSWYRGFPGSIDEVRITSGVRNFNPLALDPELSSFSFLRMGEGAALKASLSNSTGSIVDGAKISITVPGTPTKTEPLPKLALDGRHPLNVPVDTKLRPGKYQATIAVELPNWAGKKEPYVSTTTIPFSIVARQPDRMPVIMWGLGGTDTVVKEIPRLKEIGFTHCLGLRADLPKIWEQGADAMPPPPEAVRDGREMLNIALENNIRIVSGLAPARYLRDAAVGKPFLRIGRDGKHYSREDVSASFPRIQDFCYQTGLAMGRAYGAHPAYEAALLHTEVRGESQVSFHPEEIAAYKKASGEDIPAEVVIKNGVEWGKLKNFPADRVIEDDNAILKYLRWFWQKGDGWNDANSRLDAGLKEGSGRKDFWTFYDPAVRVPSISGSGGKVDVLSHWTYSYPDPIRIGLCTDELFEMARTGGHDQEVMKMTQLIWYRSQTAPQNKEGTNSNPDVWVDQDPNAAYITTAPMHLREAFWSKISRPIQGIMYHGWQSLVDTESPGADRYTNPNTRHELARLVHEVVEPLGPTLKKIPDARSDVAFLESFTSQMFARRGTYGWNHTWAGDMYHVLMYAQLQPRVMYEESLLKDGELDGIKVLVMADCDVLTRPVVEKIKAFQAAGGLIVGDKEVCPAITPDFTIERFSRSKKADESRTALLAAAAELRVWMKGKYSPMTDSSNPDVVTRRRTFGSTDYVFAVNDAREFGNYVGEFERVMENGLPSETVISLARSGGTVYDLTRGHRVSINQADISGIPLQLGPCEGRIIMVTDKPIDAVTVNAPDTAQPNTSADIKIAVNAAGAPIDAVIPVRVRIFDPAGSEAEFSGYYAAVGGKLDITLDFAPNDREGVWEIAVEELASGLASKAFVRLSKKP